MKKEIMVEADPDMDIVTGRNGTHRLMKLKILHYSDGSVSIEGIGRRGKVLNAGFYLGTITGERLMDILAGGMSGNS